MSRSPIPTPVSIAGITSYHGLELARLLAGHPGFRVVSAASDARAGNRLHELDPDLAGSESGEAVVVGHGDTVSAALDTGCKLVFIATPPVQAVRLAQPLLDAGLRVLDLSGAYRLATSEAHLRAYGVRRGDAGNRDAVYGLTEWTDPDALRDAAIVANPGRYPTAVLMALVPLVRAGLINPESLVIHASCGTSGLGRRTQTSLLFSELAGDFATRQIGCQQHTPEIVQELRRHGALPTPPTFLTHLLPVVRGLHATCVFRVPAATIGSDDVGDATEHVRTALANAYEDSPFIQVLDRPESVRLRRVVGTNRVLLSAAEDPNAGRVVVTVALDNLLKGAAGQAVQNANRMMGYDETHGLRLGTGGRP